MPLRHLASISCANYMLRTTWYKLQQSPLKDRHAHPTSLLQRIRRADPSSDSPLRSTILLVPRVLLLLLLLLPFRGFMPSPCSPFALEPFIHQITRALLPLHKRLPARPGTQLSTNSRSRNKNRRERVQGEFQAWPDHLLLSRGLLVPPGLPESTRAEEILL